VLRSSLIRMSASGPKAAVCLATADGRFRDKADIRATVANLLLVTDGVEKGLAIFGEQ
jgi:hypothetical protein